MASKLSPLDRETTGLKVFSLFTLLGWGLIGLAIVVFIAVLAPIGATYWGDNAKVARDAAVVGSQLIDQLATISWWPKFLAPLIFFGVASFMVGIALQFAAIPAIITRRTELLTRAVPLMKNL